MLWILRSFFLVSQALIVCSQKLDFVDVTVYYDAYSAYNRDFITDVLFPSYSIVGKQIDLKLVPYAINEQLITAENECPPNYRACLANIIHVCGINQTTHQDVQLSFANCMAQAQNITNSDSIKECGTASNFTTNTLTECIGGPLGVDLYTKNGYMVKSIFPPIFMGPVVTFNNFYALGGPAAWKFLRRLCLLLNNPPAGCNMRPFLPT